jgi:hypothetical protein
MLPPLPTGSCAHTHAPAYVCVCMCVCVWGGQILVLGKDKLAWTTTDAGATWTAVAVAADLYMTDVNLHPTRPAWVAARTVRAGCFAGSGASDVCSYEARIYPCDDFSLPTHRHAKRTKLLSLWWCWWWSRGSCACRSTLALRGRSSARMCGPMTGTRPRPMCASAQCSFLPVPMLLLVPQVQGRNTVPRGPCACAAWRPAPCLCHGLCVTVCVGVLMAQGLL